MAISCPVHGIRDLGKLVWVGRGLPLRRGDQQFCSCPPSMVRDLLLRRRGPLTQAEHEREVERWNREYGSCPDEEFRRDQEQIKPLLRFYEYRKSIRRM
jgi:hypothetical protein